MTALRLTVLTTLVHAFGCGATWLTAHVARDMDCPSRELEALAIGSGYYEVTGCNRQALYQCEDAKSRDVSCVRVQSTPLPVAQHEVRVRSKAALLLSCDPSALEIVRSQPGRYSAQGCGKNIDYECDSGTDCCAFERPGVRRLEEISASTSRASVVPEKNVEQNPSSSDASAAPLPVPAPNHPTGSLSKRVIREIIGERIDEVRSCYEAVLGDPPFVTGIVIVKFIISPTG